MTNKEIAKAFEAQGFKTKYLTTDYGRMTTRGVGKVMDHAFLYEERAIDQIKEIK